MRTPVGKENYLRTDSIFANFGLKQYTFLNIFTHRSD